VDPYLDRLARRLGDADPILVLAATPARLVELAERFTESDWRRSYAAGKWTAAELVAHLADTELGLGFRIRQAVAGTREAQDFDQDLWAGRYARLDAALAVETFRALRAWNLALFATFDLDDWLAPVIHAETGESCVDVVVRHIAAHDLHHLDHLDLIAEA
jgi:hypothetical protein